MNGYLRRVGVAVGSLVVVSVVNLPSAYSDLIFEESVQAPVAGGVVAPVTSQAATTTVDDREGMRQVLQSSYKQQTTAQVAQPAPVQYAPVAAPVVLAQNVAVEAAEPTVEVQNLSKFELMRRERMREELKNEDLLQYRLEELRLRDEKRRTGEIFNAAQAEAAATAPVTSAIMTEELVGAPINDPNAAQQAQSLQGALNQQQGQKLAAYGAPMYSDAVPYSQAAASYAETESQNKGASFTISPRGGYSTLITNSLFTIIPRFTAGVGVGAQINDNFAIEFGYSYAEYGVGIGNGSSFGNFYQSFIPNFSTYIYKQSMFDAGAKIYLTDRSSNFRPYVGAGGAYVRGSMTYDQMIINQLNTQPFWGGSNYWNQDYITNSFMGFVQAGIEVKVSKNINVAAGARYYQLLSATENQMANPYAFMGFGGLGAIDPNRTIAGASLARSNIFSVLGSISFLF